MHQVIGPSIVFIGLSTISSPHCGHRAGGNAERVICAGPRITIKGYHRTGAQRMIPSVLAPSYDDGGKSLDESSKIGVMNQSYSWPR